MKVRVCEGEKREANFRVDAVYALLRVGIAKYSLKAAGCLDEASRLLAERGRFYTAREVGAMFHLSVEVVNRWVRDGKLRYSQRVGMGRNARRYFSLEDIEKFSQERARVERMKSEGMRLSDAAEIVGVSDTMLRRLWHNGRIKAVMIHGERGARCLVISKDEVEHLRVERGGSGTWAEIP